MELKIASAMAIILGLMALGVFAWKFKATPLCRP